MMILFFATVYILFICAVTLTSIFLITRLQKYSINPQFTKPLIILFIIVTIALVFTNAFLFINIPFDDLFYNNNLYY